MNVAKSNLQLTGHQLNINGLRIEVYELLSFFLSSQPIAELKQRETINRKDPLHELKAFEQDCITNRLISIAVKIRILGEGERELFDCFTDSCGTITKDISRPQEITNISLRGSCDKIIHARKVSFDMNSTENGLSFLKPFINLEGTEHKKRWCANINVVEFCRESAATLDLSEVVPLSSQ